MEKTALLIIDMQKGFLDHFSSKDYGLLTENIGAAITIFKRNLVPIINIEYNDFGALNGCIHWFDEPVVKKDHDDAFYRTNLDDILKRRKITTIIPAGVQSYACVNDTVFSARKYGYEVKACLPLIGGSDNSLHEKYIPMYKHVFENVSFKDLRRIF